MPYSGVVLSCQHGLYASQAAVIRHLSGRAGLTFEIYVWLVIIVSPWFMGDDWLVLLATLALAFISRYLSA